MGAVDLSAAVAAALAEGRPVVALASSAIAQGLPWPANFETCLDCEDAVRSARAEPATIAVVEGRLRVGLGRDQLEKLAAQGLRKLTARDLGPAVAAGLSGATTASASLRVAALCGIRFLATGGLDGVHRPEAGGREDTSADLVELTRSPLAVFCAGVTAVLDVAATYQRLESLGVPVVGYGCMELPAFYTARSGVAAPFMVTGPAGVAQALAASWSCGARAVVVAIPPPEELIDAAGLIQQALKQVAGMSGPEQAPAALDAVAALSGGRAMAVNRRLLTNNAAVAGACAAKWVKGGYGEQRKGSDPPAERYGLFDDR